MLSTGLDLRRKNKCLVKVLRNLECPPSGLGLVLAKSWVAEDAPLTEYVHLRHVRDGTSGAPGIAK